MNRINHVVVTTDYSKHSPVPPDHAPTRASLHEVKVFENDSAEQSRIARV